MKAIVALSLCLSALLIPFGPAGAKDAPGVVPIEAGTPFAVAPDKAYILFRWNRSKNKLFPVLPVFLRVPSGSEIETYRAAKEAAFERDLPKLLKAYEKAGREGPAPSVDNYGFTDTERVNVFAIGSGKFVAEAPAERTYLVEVPAGEYVLYGVSLGGGAVSVCTCLGTVKARADAGVVTDLGTILISRTAQKSPEPELAADTGLGKSIDFGYYLYAEAVRPATAATPFPTVVPADKRRLAEYHAVPSYSQPGVLLINRLAPVPGVLGYRAGKVVDERTGAVIE